jgi:hypothetical protein
MADPDLGLNCPRCGERLTHVTIEGDGTHIYICTAHGECRLSLDGYLRGGVGPYGRPSRPVPRH